MAEEHASLQVVIQVRSYVRLHVLPSPALKVVFIASENLMRSYMRLHVLPSPALKAVVLAYESLLFDAQRPDIKYEIFVKFEICYISILLVSRRRLSRVLRRRRGRTRRFRGLGPEWRINPAEC